MSFEERDLFVKEIKRYAGEVRMINDQVSLYSLIINCKNDEKCLEKLNIAPAFFSVIRYSLTVSIVLAVARLYDLDNSEKTISKLIGKSNFNYRLFQCRKVQRFYDEQLCTIEELECGSIDIREKLEYIDEEYKSIRDSTALENIRILRDKIFAHNDKKYFLSQDDAPLVKVEEVNDLMKFAGNICDELLLYLAGESYSTSSMNICDFQDLIKSIQINKRCKNGRA